MRIKVTKKLFRGIYYSVDEIERLKDFIFAQKTVDHLPTHLYLYPIFKNKNEFWAQLFHYPLGPTDTLESFWNSFLSNFDLKNCRVQDYDGTWRKLEYLSARNKIPSEYDAYIFFVKGNEEKVFLS